MEERHLLTELCRICNNQIPKYCCPRCSSRTCSLTCYKRHKLWSQCSGKRDPAAYIKKGQLATPAGIDRDYNFLTGIERAFEKADKNADERGIRMYGAGKQDAKDGSNLDKYLKANNIRVERAPQGMGRQRSNKTRWLPKQKSMMWTIEWVFQDGAKLLKECGAERSISEAFETTVPRSQQPSVAMASKKRKLNPGLAQEHATSTVTTVGALHLDASLEKPEDSTAPAAGDLHVTPPSRYFYLAKSHTSHTSRVLIPLDPSANITACLRNRTVLEYPTFYVLAHPQSALPEEFITEAEYLGHTKKEAEEIEHLLKIVPQLAEEGADGTEEQRNQVGLGDNRPLDERMIAEMLSKDVGMVS